jgi:hypothetical protein
MQVEQTRWVPGYGWSSAAELGSGAQLVLAFGARDLVADPARFADLRMRYPAAAIACASTAGEIAGTAVTDDDLVVTAVQFARTRVRADAVPLEGSDASGDVGRELARRLAAPDLRHVFVLSEGLRVNGTALARGLHEGVPDGVTVTGGMAGDGARLQRTVVGLDAPPTSGRVVAIGFYGDALRVGYGSLGGWDPFGPDRLVTRACDNVVYEFDGRPALELYRLYMGQEAADLPGSGILYPLAVRVPGRRTRLVRTMVGLDEAAQSVRFSAGVPEGSHAQLMKATFDRLVDGAVGAAESCGTRLDGMRPELALLVSCIGRKLVLQQRVEEEVEGVCDVLGDGPVLAGFYSYGEICPHGDSIECELHNQTMTITALAEAA